MPVDPKYTGVGIGLDVEYKKEWDQGSDGTATSWKIDPGRYRIIPNKEWERHVYY